jgi:hypothetical protein
MGGFHSDFFRCLRRKESFPAIEDIAVVHDAAEQRGGHRGIAEDLYPFPEAEVRCDGQSGTLIELTDPVEQQGTTGLPWIPGQFCTLVNNSRYGATR